MATPNLTQLLFEISGNSGGGQKALHDLTGSFGHELGEIGNITKETFGKLEEGVHEFIGEKLPFVGNLFIKLSESIHGVHVIASTTEGSILKLSKAVDDIATKSGKGVDEVTKFIGSFGQLENQAQRDAAAISFFGEATAQKLIPQLDRASKQMNLLSGSGVDVKSAMSGAAGATEDAGAAAEASGAGFAAMAGPVGIALVAVLAIIAAEVEFINISFEAAEKAADFGGEMERAAVKTGLTVEQLLGLRVLADENKVSFDQLTNGLAKYLKNVELAKSGNKSLLELFDNIGISIKDLATPQDAIRALFEAIQREGLDAFLQSAAALKLLSKAGTEFLPVLVEMEGDLDGAAAKAQKLLGFTTADAQATAELEKSLADAKTALLGLELALGKFAGPTFVSVVNAITNALSNNRDLIIDVVLVIGAIITALTLTIPLVQVVILVTANVIAAITNVVQAVRMVIPHLGFLATAWDVVAASAKEAARQLGLAKDELSRTYETTSGDIPAFGKGEKEKPPEVLPDALPSQKERDKQAAEDRISVIKAESAEAKRVAADSVAQQEILYRKGQISRATETANIIAALQARTNAEKAAINAEILRKGDELLAVEKNDQERVKKIQKIQEERTNLEQEARNKDSELQREIDKRKADDHIAAQKAEVEHQKAVTAIFIAYGQDRIKEIQDEVRLGKKSATEGEAEIEGIEQAAFDKRRVVLSNQIKLAGQNLEDQKKLKDEKAKLDQEETANLAEQKRRQAKILEDDAQLQRDLKLASIQTELKLETIRDQTVIATMNALAQNRLRSEASVQEQIEQIQLNAIDREIRAVQDRQKLTAQITDPSRRKREEQKLNDDIRILMAERGAIVSRGVDDHKAALDRDARNLEEYAQIVLRNEKQLNEQQRSIAQTDVELLVLRNASRLTILAAEKKNALEDLELRRKEAADSIKVEHDAALLRLKGLANEEEQKEKLEDLFHKRSLLSEEQFEKQKKAILGKFKKEEAAAGPLGGFNAGLMSGQLSQLENGVQSFSDVTTVALNAVGAAFHGIGDAVGAAVQSFVLYGNAGKSVRQVTAEILASLAQQAAVQAIYELAQGLAVLALAYFGVPNAGPSASAHFVAAAVFAGIAGIAAVAGRGVAGNAFAQSGTGAAGTGAPGSPGANGKSSSSSSTSSQAATTIINANRPTVTLELTLRHDAGSAFAANVVKTIVKNVNSNGTLRDVIVKEAK